MTERPVLTANPHHARVVLLLAQHRELTDAQLVRRYQTQSHRRTDPWPPLAESSLRTRREELTEWGEVIKISHDGRSARGRPMRVWALNPVPRAYADFHGRHVESTPLLRRTLDQLLTETDDLLVTEALAAFSRRLIQS